ncbi:MAG: ECF transporter S component [Candidatus Zixiibacteriota bacterium]
MRPRTVAAIGLYSALAYAGSFVLMVIPNATLGILMVFFGGYGTGTLAGCLIGAISATLISLFNPYGMAMLPILLAQIGGYSCVGMLGGSLANRLNARTSVYYLLSLGLLGVTTALLYQIPVSIVDAWLFGPFRERLVVSASFALITVASNVIFFIVLFPILAKLQKVAIFKT